MRNIIPLRNIDLLCKSNSIEYTLELLIFFRENSYFYQKK
nr:MAG TPA: hypothetical protein [Caudoviricetes sp.]